MTALRLRIHAMREALRLLRRRPGIFLLSVSLCATAAWLPLFVACLAFALSPVASRLDFGPEVSVFISLSATGQDIKSLQARLGQYDSVERVRWVTRDEALADLGGRGGTGLPMADLKLNPLPDTLIVAFRPAVDPAVVEAAATAFRKLPRVDAVQFDAGWYRKAAALARLSGRILAIIAGANALLMMLIVVGTVRLQAAATRDELRLLQLIGADAGQIRRPYVYAGAGMLVVALALATSLAWGALQWFTPTVVGVANLYGADIVLDLPPWPILAGGAMIALGLAVAAASLGFRASLRSAA